MPRSKNRWAATSQWQSIVVVTPTGKTEELRPDTPVYLSTKKKVMVIAMKEVLDNLFQLGLNNGEEDPWHHAVLCASSMVVMRQMKIHDPVTGKVVGRASLTPPRKMMH